jgi:hypothetical protein
MPCWFCTVKWLRERVTILCYVFVASLVILVLTIAQNFSCLNKS